MSRRIPVVVFTGEGRRVVGEVDVDAGTAELDEAGVELLDNLSKPPVGEDGEELEVDTSLQFQFVLQPYFPGRG